MGLLCLRWVSSGPARSTPLTLCPGGAKNSWKSSLETQAKSPNQFTYISIAPRSVFKEKKDCLLLWLKFKDTGELLCASDIVDVCTDTVGHGRFVNHPCPQHRPGLSTRHSEILRRAGHRACGGPVQQGPDSTTSAERHLCPAWCLCGDRELTPRRGHSCQSRPGSSKGERFLSAEPKSVFLTSFLLSSYFAPRATQGRSAHPLPGHCVGIEKWCCDLPGDHLSPGARLRPLATEAASSWRDLKRRHLPGQQCVREEQETLPVTCSVTVLACMGSQG